MSGTAERPLVSICMPVSRGADHFEAALRSVLEQTWPELEAVVTDDSSGDMRAVAEGFGDPRVRYFANPRRLGLAGNHTAALSRARGAFLGFLHDDDRFLPRYVESAMEVFLADPSVGLVFTDCLEGPDDGHLRRRRFPGPPGRYDDFVPEVIRHGLLPSTTMLRREVWDQGRDEWPDIAPADMVLFTDAAAAGWPFHYLDEPLAVYRRHAGQTSADALAHRGGKVELWDSYRFEDARHERIRRSELALWLRARAATHLRHGDGAAARRDAAAARAVDPERPGAKALALDAAVRLPWAVPALEKLRGRLSRSR
jgi:glycosyltransferase involved in cell wall biosynthesis